MQLSETTQTNSIVWNPWHGCHKKSEGCLNCYMYRIDEQHERNPSVVQKTNNFMLPVKKNRQKQYKVPPKTLIYTCFTSDLFVEEADEWRVSLWSMVKERMDCRFFFLTKRPERFFQSLPKDWGSGYPNVTMGVSCENQKRADERLPLLLELPVIHKTISIAPMIGPVDISPYLDGPIEMVVCDGESGPDAREIDYSWILSVRDQCIQKQVDFTFRQTGANFIKDGKRYYIPKKEQHIQAKKAGINFIATIREGCIRGSF